MAVVRKNTVNTPDYLSISLSYAVAILEANDRIRVLKQLWEIPLDGFSGLSFSKYFCAILRIVLYTPSPRLGKGILII